MSATTAGHRVAEFLAPLRRPAYRRLWLSQVASETGDWAARLALAALVYGQTQSALWSALVFVGGLMPMLGPGQLLATYADVRGRRAVMVSADLIRVAVFAFLALPLHLPVWALLALSVVAGLATAPFEAARGCAVVELSDAEDLPAAVSLTHATQDLAVLAGYALGGWLLSVVGSNAALAVNAGTFAVSAALLCGLPAMRPKDGQVAEHPARRIRAAVGALRADPLVLRIAVLATVAVASGSALDALVVPITDAAGMGWLAGPMLAAVGGLSLLLTVMLGSTHGEGRLLDITAHATWIPSAVCAGALLTGWLPAQLVGILATGALYVTLVAAGIVVGPRLPEGVRATCFAVLGGTLTAGQVGLSAIGGAVADRLNPATAGAVILLAPLAAVLWHRLRPLRVQQPPQTAESQTTTPVTNPATTAAAPVPTAKATAVTTATPAATVA